MSWKRRQRELARLRAKYRGSRYALPFPDLSVAPSPCSNTFAPATPWAKGITAEGVTISHLHKSGYQVMLASEAREYGRKT